MGKRELVLIASFIVLGALVYEFTAAPPPPGSEEFSIGGIFNKLKREIHGAQESAPALWTETIAIDANVRQLRVNVPRASDLTVTGEDRADVAVELHAVARGYDQADARAAAGAVKLQLERTGDAVVVSFDPALQRLLPKNARIDQLAITVKVPQRIAARIEPHPGRLVASNLAAAEVMGSRGETRIRGISGHLQLTHSGGRLEVEEVHSLKLTARSTRGSVKNVAAAFTLDATGGEIEIAGVVGPLDAEIRNTALTLNDLNQLKPPLRVNATGGRITIDGLRTEARVDGRETDIDVTMAAAAPVTIFSTAEDILVTAPPTAYTLDAVATDGRLHIEDGSLAPKDETDQRVSGAVRGGGPTLMLRVSRSDITVRKPQGKAADKPDGK